MTHPEDPRLAEAKAMSMADVVHRLGIQRLQRMGHELIGPCPQCGGTDRFGVNLRKGLFQCRRCEARGDQVALVMFDRGLDFKAALDWLCGPAEGISDAERAERKRKADTARRATEAEADRARARAVAEAREVWDAAARHPQAPVAGYLALRGITLRRVPDALRFAPDLPYMVQIDGKWREVHRGPAMLAAILAPDGGFRGCHRTWFDLSAPQGKIRILHPVTGEALARKKSIGSVKGNAIRLTGAHRSDTLVMGEGIETTCSAAMPRALPQAMFWAGISLGNMGGARETGKGLRFAGIPDLDDARAFVPPPWVTRLVFLMDGDSDPRQTRATLEAGLRRAMALRARAIAGGDDLRPLRGQIAAAPQGKDFNDVLLQGSEVEG